MQWTRLLSKAHWWISFHFSQANTLYSSQVILQLVFWKAREELVTMKLRELGNTSVEQPEKVFFLFFVSPNLKKTLIFILTLLFCLSPLFFFLVLCRGGESFLCTSGICIPRKLQCNGYNDCDDWSDEAHCSMWQAGWGLSAGHGFCSGAWKPEHSVVWSWQPAALGWTAVSLLFFSEQMFIFPHPTR